MDIIKLETFLKQKNQPSFRLDQIKKAFFQNQAESFDQITTLPLFLRQELAAEIPWLTVKPEKIINNQSNEAIKALLMLEDKTAIESVVVFYRNWTTACLSVMAGCPLGCTFCTTGQQGFKRNLTQTEIVDQVIFWNWQLKKRQRQIDRVVLMGMGEPFLNWDEVWPAIQIINNKDGLNIGQRHITISTAGITEKVREFTSINSQINLAISLHSPFQEKREKIMPVAKKYPLLELMAAAKDYVEKTRRKLFFEYCLIDGFNDSEKDVAELRRIFTSPLFHLNLISLNPTDSRLRPSPRMQAFCWFLDKYKIAHTLRRSFGSDIKAACGQLAGETVGKKLT